jgi:hypothetical protein
MADTAPMGSQLAEALNRDCYCIAVNKETLHDSLEAHLRDSGLPEHICLQTHLYFYGRDTCKKWSS